MARWGCAALRALYILPLWPAIPLSLAWSSMLLLLPRVQNISYQPSWAKASHSEWSALSGLQHRAALCGVVRAHSLQTDRPVSLEAKHFWGLLFSTLITMKIIAWRKMHPLSFTNPLCGNVLTFNEVHLCWSAGSEGFRGKTLRSSQLHPPPVLLVIWEALSSAWILTLSTQELPLLVWGSGCNKDANELVLCNPGFPQRISWGAVKGEEMIKN